MLLRSSPPKRRGATLVESALVLNLTILLILGMVVVGLGVFRYQQVSALAREAARWASVHGGEWAKETNSSLTTATSIYNAAIKPMAVGIDPSSLTTPPDVTWDNSSQMPVYFDSTSGKWKNNQVTVKVTYTWIPEAFLGGVTFSSTSVMTITY
jgi:Flp pilus assembly protein TadG